MTIGRIILVALLLSLVDKCGSQVHREEQEPDWQKMTVTASAYNSLAVQGQGDPTVTAWGDTLRPGIKSVAVSRDLIKKGLDYGTPLKVEGLEGIYVVNDKMNRRWKNKIDIYMGIDRQKALQWGRRKVTICFPVNDQVLQNSKSIDR